MGVPTKNKEIELKEVKIEDAILEFDKLKHDRMLNRGITDTLLHAKKETGLGTAILWFFFAAGLASLGASVFGL